MRKDSSFVRSGLVDLYRSSLRDFGFNGYDWSSSSVMFDQVISATAYDLGFSAPGVNPSGGPDNRYYGFPLRCPNF